MACNNELVRNIQVCKTAEKLTIFTNGGPQQYEQVADMSIPPMKVHFNALSMANILSLSDVVSIADL